jgi:hypothetical protein
MGIQYDVKAVHTETSAQIISGRTRIKGYQCLSGGTAGDVIFYDTISNSATGTVVLQFNVPNNTNNPFSTLIPGDGIVCINGAYVSAPANCKVTVFYG